MVSRGPRFRFLWQRTLIQSNPAINTNTVLRSNSHRFDRLPNLIDYRCSSFGMAYFPKKSINLKKRKWGNRNQTCFFFTYPNLSRPPWTQRDRSWSNDSNFGMHHSTLTSRLEVQLKEGFSSSALVGGEVGGMTDTTFQVGKERLVAHVPWESSLSSPHQPRKKNKQRKKNPTKRVAWDFNWLWSRVDEPLYVRRPASTCELGGTWGTAKNAKKRREEIEEKKKKKRITLAVARPIAALMMMSATWPTDATISFVYPTVVVVIAFSFKNHVSRATSIRSDLVKKCEERPPLPKSVSTWNAVHTCSQACRVRLFIKFLFLSLQITRD